VGREVLSPEERHTEQVMLGLRLADGLPLDTLDAPSHAAVKRTERDGLLTITSGNRLVLTRRGRLLADTVIRNLLVP
jgi:oxygen-independent coproporphyrinogen-3 oxidase